MRSYAIRAWTLDHDLNVVLHGADDRRTAGFPGAPNTVQAICGQRMARSIAKVDFWPDMFDQRDEALATSGASMSVCVECARKTNVMNAEHRAMAAEGQPLLWDGR